jgi:hypothetical protein
MISKLRFRHLFGELHKEKYENIRNSGVNMEANGVKGNANYIAMAWKSSGGGKLAILPNTE